MGKLVSCKALTNCYIKLKAGEMESRTRKGDVVDVELREGFNLPGCLVPVDEYVEPAAAVQEDEVRKGESLPEKPKAQKKPSEKTKSKAKSKSEGKTDDKDDD